MLLIKFKSKNGIKMLTSEVAETNFLNFSKRNSVRSSRIFLASPGYEFVWALPSPHWDLAFSIWDMAARGTWRRAEARAQGHLSFLFGLIVRRFTEFRPKFKKWNSGRISRIYFAFNRSHQLWLTLKYLFFLLAPSCPPGSCPYGGNHDGPIWPKRTFF